MTPRLLIIDDEPNLRYSLEHSLGSESLEIITAATASQGIELVRSRLPDAVLLDVRLPDLPGLEAFDKIREIDPRLPVIIMTAYSTTDTAIEAMKRVPSNTCSSRSIFAPCARSSPRRSS